MIKFKKTDPQYKCFSNFYLTKIRYDGLVFTSSEAAWQAQKSLDKNIRKTFQQKTPSNAKYEGRRIKLRPDWEKIKYQLMVDVCYAKFSQNPQIKEILLSTKDEELIEDTTGWHDNLWGSCDCPKCKNIAGKNLLGKALMEVRNKLNKI